MTDALSRVARFVRTVRHLRARQAAALLLRGVPRALGRPTAPTSRPHPDALAALATLGPVSGDALSVKRAHAWISGHVLGLGLDVAWSGDWHETGPHPLWRYHLLYHEHLADLAWAARDGRAPAALTRLDEDLRRWFTTTRVGDHPAWDAYPLSVRLVNWLRILAWAGSSLPAATVSAIQQGIAAHRAHLRRSFEWHLDGNHLLRNAWAVALADAACGDRAALDGSLRSFSDILDDQVDADGWHAERTPMYHARIVRDLIELRAVCAATGRVLDARTAGHVERMRDALHWMTRADGALWALNDTAVDHEVALGGLGDARSPDARSGVRWFRAAGAVVAIDETDGDRVRFDAGVPSPPHQPGHAHAGALGFELDLGGLPCIVDGGCSGYDADPWRDHLRGTSAHNTIAIDGLDQSEMWATFRVGGRARVADVSTSGGPRDLRIQASVRPWHAPSVVHRRQLHRDGRALVCEDAVDGASGRRVEGFLHLDPAWDVQRAGDREFSLSCGGTRASLRLSGAVSATLHRGDRDPLLGWRAVGFGRVVPAWSLRMRAEEGGARPWSFTVEPR